jgi:hypothetical protein
MGVGGAPRAVGGRVPGGRFQETEAIPSRWTLRPVIGLRRLRIHLRIGDTAAATSFDIVTRFRRHSGRRATRGLSGEAPGC